LIQIFYFNLATTLAGSFFLFIENSTTGKVTVFGLKDWILLILLIGFGFCSQVFLSIAFRYEKAGRVASMRYVQIALAFVADIMIFKTSYGWNEIMGAVLILFFGILIFFVKVMKTN